MKRFIEWYLNGWDMDFVGHWFQYRPHLIVYHCALTLSPIVALLTWLWWWLR